MIVKDDLTADLESLYINISREGREAILYGREKTDPMLHHLESDGRIGLSLIITITGRIAADLTVLAAEIQQIEPEQYYYPASDLHVTIMDLIGAHENYQRNEAVINQYIQIVKNALHGLTSFDIRFKGIVAGNAAILAKGYYGGALLNIRRQMRQVATERGIELKERYQSISAHSTIARFRTNLQNREKLLAVIEKHHQYDMGTFQVNELDLVIHDWYNRKKELVGKFIL